MKEEILFVMYLAMALVSFIIGLIAGLCEASSTERGRAVEAGVGWWWVNEKTGETEFVYGKRG